ncbi:MAG: class IV adenylate cyclase [Patescibacteria group bacterium]|nr:class IV adenylate cyclase [Patescibacteria group bacterium]
MKEIEAKILDIDVTDTMSRILEAGAEKTFDGNVDVVFYDYPDDKLRSEGRRLRLRSFGDRVELTYKKNLSKETVKIAEELQVNVSNFDETKQILEGIGLVPVYSYTKHRVSFCIKDACFEVDSIPGCPPFLEIEAVTEEKVFEWVKKLGFSAESALPWSGNEVIEYYS